MKNLFVLILLCAQTAWAFPAFQTEFNPAKNAGTAKSPAIMTPRECSDYTGSYRGQCRSGNIVEPTELVIEQTGCTAIKVDSEDYMLGAPIFKQEEHESFTKSIQGVFMWDHRAQNLSYGIHIVVLDYSQNELGLQINDGVMRLVGDTLFMNGTVNPKMSRNGEFQRAMRGFTCTLVR